MEEEIRLGFIGIVMNDRSAATAVNVTLGQHSRVIRARVGVPDADTQAAVIGLIVEGDNPSLGTLTAHLGNLPGVEVKSALVKKRRTVEETVPQEERT